MIRQQFDVRAFLPPGSNIIPFSRLLLPDTLLPTALRWLIYPMVVVLGLAAMALAMVVWS
jgi:hypothetical protein